jgi:hypothetical protein
MQHRQIRPTPSFSSAGRIASLALGALFAGGLLVAGLSSPASAEAPLVRAEQSDDEQGEDQGYQETASEIQLPSLFRVQSIQDPQIMSAAQNLYDALLAFQSSPSAVTAAAVDAAAQAAIAVTGGVQSGGGNETGASGPSGGGFPSLEHHHHGLDPDEAICFLVANTAYFTCMTTSPNAQKPLCGSNLLLGMLICASV